MARSHSRLGLALFATSVRADPRPMSVRCRRNVRPVNVAMPFATCRQPRHHGTRPVCCLVCYLSVPVCLLVTRMSRERGDSNPRYRLRGTTVFEESPVGPVAVIGCASIPPCPSGIPLLCWANHPSPHYHQPIPSQHREQPFVGRCCSVVLPVQLNDGIQMVISVSAHHYPHCVKEIFHFGRAVMQLEYNTPSLVRIKESHPNAIFILRPSDDFNSLIIHLGDRCVELFPAHRVSKMPNSFSMGFQKLLYYGEWILVQIAQ